MRHSGQQIPLSHIQQSIPTSQTQQSVPSSQTQQSVPANHTQQSVPTSHTRQSASISHIQQPVLNSTNVALAALHRSNSDTQGPSIYFRLPINKTLVTTPEHDIYQLSWQGYNYIRVVSRSYSLDGLNAFAESLPWHRRGNSTYYLADFVQCLRDMERDSTAPPALASMIPRLLPELCATLRAEVMDHEGLKFSHDRYDVWSVLVLLLGSPIGVSVDQTGQIVNAEIEDLWARDEDVVINFVYNSQPLPSRRIPWHDFRRIEAYGVMLPRQEQRHFNPTDDTGGQAWSLDDGI